MRISITTHGEYEPAVWGNRDRDPDERIVVSYRHLSAREEQDLIRLESVEEKGDGPRYRVVADDNARFRAQVTGIRGLVAEIDGVEVPVTTADQLLETPGLDELFLDVLKHLRAATAVDQKN